MAFNFIPNQPVIFDPLINTKNYLGNYINRPKVSNTDVQQFAVGRVEIENVLEQVANNEFNNTSNWNTNGSWTVAGNGYAEYVAGAGPLETETVVFYPGLFIVGATVEGLTQGSIEVKRGTTLINVPITEDGEFSGLVFTFNYEKLSFNPVGINAGAKITFTTVNIFFDNMTAGLFWEDGTKIVDLPKLLSSSNIFTSDFNTDPTSGQYGCIKYGVNNDFNTQLLNRPGFSSQGTWEGINTTITGNTFGNFTNNNFRITFNQANGIHALRQQNVLEIGREYKFSINLKDATILQNIYVVSEAGDPVISTPFDDVVVYTFTADQTTFELHFENDANLGTVDVRWIDLYETPFDNGNWTFSNVFEYGPSNLNTLLLEWDNNEDIFDLPFDSGFFALSLRLCAKVNAPEYNSERETTDTINGTRYKRYFLSNKTESLIIEPQTQLIHDAISIIGACSTFAIDGVLYEFEQEDYQPDWSENDDNFAGAEIKVVRVPVSTTAVRCVSGPNEPLNTNFVE